MGMTPSAGQGYQDHTPPAPIRHCQSPPRGGKGFKSIYLFVHSHSSPQGFASELHPGSVKGRCPQFCLGFAGGTEAARPSSSPRAGKVSFTLQMLCKRAELFVLPEEKIGKKTPKPTTYFPWTPSQRQLNNFWWNTKHTYSLEMSQQHPAWKISLQIIKIWQWEKQLKTGLTKECAIKITAGLPTCAVCYY